MYNDIMTHSVNFALNIIIIIIVFSYYIQSNGVTKNISHIFFLFCFTSLFSSQTESSFFYYYKLGNPIGGDVRARVANEPRDEEVLRARCGGVMVER